MIHYLYNQRIYRRWKRCKKLEKMSRDSVYKNKSLHTDEKDSKMFDGETVLN